MFLENMFMVWTRPLRIALASFARASSSRQSVCRSAPNQERLARLWRIAFFLSTSKHAAAAARTAHGTREGEANMTEPAGKPKEETDTLLQSSLQLLAALLTGAFNSLACLLLLSPPITLWLAWKHPYIVLPPAVAYYFLSYDGAERKDGRPWPAFSRSFWIFRLARGYHDLQLQLDPALEASKMTGDEKFVFGLHPHGVLSDYRILLDGVTGQHFPKLRSWRALAASVLFKFPVWREISLWSHCIDAGRETAQYALDRGHSLFVVPGGEQEQILGEHGKEVLYLKKRMGFVKLALRNGIPLVPVYVFGANDVFRTSTFLRKARLTLVKRLRVAVPLFWGRFGVPIPIEVPLRVVFGAPLSFGNGSGAKTASNGGGGLREVSDEELREAHGAYMDALKRLFDDNKAKFGYADRELCVY